MVVNQLTFLQLDPTAAVAPSADLVAWTRLGAAYQPVHLQQALERDRTLFEHRAMVRPMADLGLIHDRRRALDLFDFEYHLEMYVPKAKRHWGLFALPVLQHDRLVGKVDATADRKNSILQVHAIHQDVRFTRSITAAVHAELEALASWLGLAAVSIA